MNTLWATRLAVLLSLPAIVSPAPAQDAATAETPTLIACMTDATALLQAPAQLRSDRQIPLVRNDDGDDVIAEPPPPPPPPPMPAREPPKLPEELALAPMLAAVCPELLIEAGNSLQPIYCQHASLVTWDCDCSPMAVPALPSPSNTARVNAALTIKQRETEPRQGLMHWICIKHEAVQCTANASPTSTSPNSST